MGSTAYGVVRHPIEHVLRRMEKPVSQSVEQSVDQSVEQSVEQCVRRGPVKRSNVKMTFCNQDNAPRGA
eukprot:3774330-Pyramimonas_sp.AAC.1